RRGTALLIVALAHGGQVVPVHSAHVVAVGAVLRGQLPVAIVGVGRGGAQHFQTLLTLVDDLVNDPGALAEVFLQRGDVSIQAAEQEAAVALEARQALEVMGTVGVELLRITALLLIPSLEQLAVVAESPAVERAGEGRLVAALLAAQGGATVRTGVEQRLQLPVPGAGDHHRLTTYG